jgi:hypothetical protein
MWKKDERILTAKNKRLNIVVLPQHPYEQLGKVIRVYELTKRFACSRDDEGGVVF